MSMITSGLNYSYLGAMCAQFRKLLKINQQTVANEVGVSRELVSKFEQGKKPNALVFMWYIKMGIFDWVPVDRWEGWNLLLDIPINRKGV